MNIYEDKLNELSLLLGRNKEKCVASCECSLCVYERSLRDEIESMSEHKQIQQTWVNQARQFIVDKLNKENK